LDVRENQSFRQIPIPSIANRSRKTKESINEANPEAMVGKKLGALLKSLDKTVAQYKKKANVKSHMNFFEAGVKNVMRKHGIK